MVIRLVGTNETEGRDLLQQAGLIATRSMTEAIEQAVAQAKGGAHS
jgi:succinyl-CoA synthetase beta subunit